MIDADGATSGTWSQSGGKLYLAFYNGSVTYTGTIKNNVMSGAGNNGAQTWNFSLKRQ